jgi:hypothetical protein
MELIDAIYDYVDEIGKKRSELADMRIAESHVYNGPPRWEVQLVFQNEYVRYVRVALFQAEVITFRSKSVTRKTRLTVPIGEVPEGAEFYTVFGEGPLYKDTSPDGRIQGRRCHEHTVYLDNMPKTKEVEVEFYYARGEGAIAGNELWVTESELAKVAGDNLAELVNGCKFDFWAKCHSMKTGGKSK